MDPKINSVIPFPAQNTLKKVAGIYAIVNLVNNKQYIGSTENLRFRFNAHKRLLREQKHHSYKLQRAYNKYGEGCFEFRVLFIFKFCTNIDELLKKQFIRNTEQRYLDFYQCYSPKNYNVSRISTGIALTREKASENSKKGWQRRKETGDIHLTQETKDRISCSLRGNPNLINALQNRWETNPIPVYEFSPDGEFVRKHESTKSCAEYYNTKVSIISKYINRKLKNRKLVTNILSREEHIDSNEFFSKPKRKFYPRYSIRANHSEKEEHLFFSIIEAADFFKVKENTVYCWISKNNNPDGWKFTKVYIKNNGKQD